MSETIGNTETMRDRGNNGALRDSTASIMQDLEALRKDVSRLASAATNAAGEQFKVAGERLGRLRRDVGTRATGSAGYVSEQVRMHPGVAIGVALGTGLLLGMLMSSRSGSHLTRGGTRTHSG